MPKRAAQRGSEVLSSFVRFSCPHSSDEYSYREVWAAANSAVYGLGLEEAGIAPRVQLPPLQCGFDGQVVPTATTSRSSGTWATDVETIARDLAKTARACGSTDDISVRVVQSSDD